MTRQVLVLIALWGCNKATDTNVPPRPAPPATPVPVDAAAADAAIDAAVVVDAAVPVDAASPPADAAVKPKPKGCTADKKHCCMKDGRIVPTTGCDPDNGHGVERGGDGMCLDTFCRCLPGSARIATPRGDIAIDTLTVGDLVYTTDTTGRRITMPILAIASVPFDAKHPVSEVILADGRTLRASAGHPLVDGSLVGSLRVGAVLDGSFVSEIRTQSIEGPTWDLRPAGPTGTYWTDGVHVGSTLRAP